MSTEVINTGLKRPLPSRYQSIKNRTGESLWCILQRPLTWWHKGTFLSICNVIMEDEVSILVRKRKKKNYLLVLVQILLDYQYTEGELSSPTHLFSNHRQLKQIYKCSNIIWLQHNIEEKANVMMNGKFWNQINNNVYLSRKEDLVW